MLAKIHSMATLGLSCLPIEVEVDIAKGMPTFSIVGLGDTAVQESRDRIRSALKNSEIKFPVGRMTVNLAPADIKKVGPSFDLPIALGILFASLYLPNIPSSLEKTLVIGELSLNGNLRSVSGILPITMAAKKQGFERIFLPAVNAREAALVEGIDVYAVENIRTLALHFLEENTLVPLCAQDIPIDPFAINTREDFKYVKGQEQAKRALEISASGGHNCLMNGTPGSGKTLMARALRSILPQMTRAEALEVTQIYSIANLLPSGQPLISARPFRTVHHTASSVSLVGGGKSPQPGEISLAHRGVLFLDELNDTNSNVRQSQLETMLA